MFEYLYECKLTFLYDLYLSSSHSTWTFSDILLYIFFQNPIELKLITNFKLSHDKI